MKAHGSISTVIKQIAEFQTTMTGVAETAQATTAGTARTHEGSLQLEQMALGLQRLVGTFQTVAEARELSGVAG